VRRSMAVGAQRDEIVLRIATRLAPPLDVMDLESGQGAAKLATPTVPFKDLPVQLAIISGARRIRRSLGRGLTAASVSCRKNSCFWTAGRSHW